VENSVESVQNLHLSWKFSTGFMFYAKKKAVNLHCLFIGFGKHGAFYQFSYLNGLTFLPGSV